MNSSSITPSPATSGTASDSSSQQPPPPLPPLTTHSPSPSLSPSPTLPPLTGGSPTLTTTTILPGGQARKQCNCKNSRCLKLYCECFAAGAMCVNCHCRDCHNNTEHAAERNTTIQLTLQKNPRAFKPKIASSPLHSAHTQHSPTPASPAGSPTHALAGPHRSESTGEVIIRQIHEKGCHCKKSHCIKAYCECYQMGLLCSENCRCADCLNHEHRPNAHEHPKARQSNNHIPTSSSPSSSLSTLQQAASSYPPPHSASASSAAPHIPTADQLQAAQIAVNNAILQAKSEPATTPSHHQRPPSATSNSIRSLHTIPSIQPAVKSQFAGLINNSVITGLARTLIESAQSAENSISEQAVADLLLLSTQLSNTPTPANQTDASAPFSKSNSNGSKRAAETTGASSHSQIQSTPKKHRPNATINTATATQLSPRSAMLVCDEPDDVIMSTATKPEPTSASSTSAPNSASLLRSNHTINSVSQAQEKAILQEVNNFITKVVAVSQRQ